MISLRKMCQLILTISIHLNMIGGGKSELFKICIGTAIEHSSVLYGLFPGTVFSLFELDLSFKVDVPREKDSGVDIVVHGLNGHIEFRMVTQDMIGRLPLRYERLYNRVDAVYLGSRPVDALSRRGKHFFVFSVSEERVVVILYRHGAFVSGLIAAVTDKRGFVEPFTGFTLEVFAYLITFMTAAAFPVTDKKLIAYIGLPAVKALYTEVLRVVEGALVPCVHGTMQLYFFRDGSRILAKKFGDIFEGPPLIKGFINELSVFESEVLLVSWYQMRHRENLLYLKYGRPVKDKAYSPDMQ